MKKWIIAGLLCVVVGGVAVAFTRTDSGDGDHGPKTVTVELGTLVDKALVTGEIMPRHEVDVKSKISGTVARIFVQEGERVNMGDPVLEVRPNPTPLEYAQKKRTLEMQELVEKQRGADLDRVKGLLDRGMASRADFDAAKEASERAVLRRKMAEEELAILDHQKRNACCINGGLADQRDRDPQGVGRFDRKRFFSGDPRIPVACRCGQSCFLAVCLLGHAPVA